MKMESWWMGQAVTLRFSWNVAIKMVCIVCDYISNGRC